MPDHGVADVHLGSGVEVQQPCDIGRLPESGRLGPVVIGAGSVIRSFAVIYANAVLGERVKVGHNALIREDNLIGDDCSIGSHSVLEGRCALGQRVRVHSRCFLSSVTAQDDVFIGPGVIFTDDPHPPCPRYIECAQGVTVEQGAKIGGGAVLLPGVTIGARALVGGGAVVSRDVPAGAVVVGNPARVIKDVNDLVCFAGLFGRVFEWEER